MTQHLLQLEFLEDELPNAADATTNDPQITADTIEYAHDLISNNPLWKMMHLKGWTPQQLAAAKSQDNSEEIYNFIVNLINLPFCFNKDQKSINIRSHLLIVDALLLSIKH
jgi:hypothetical protein